jgi:hypothetical protein
MGIPYGDTKYGIPGKDTIENAIKNSWNERKSGSRNGSKHASADATVKAAKVLIDPFMQAIGDSFK